MSKIAGIPDGIKSETLDFIKANDLPEDHQRLIKVYLSMCPAGADSQSCKHWECNKELLYPVVFVASFYTDFIPFYNKIKGEQR